MVVPFKASQFKLDRAAKHLAELQEAVAVYLAEKPVAIIVEPFPGGAAEAFGTRAWLARIRKPVPYGLSAIVGDIVHNLRTALDLLACDLVRLAGKSTKGVYFPFCENAVDLPKAIKERNLHRAGPDIVQAVRNLKPYKGGNVALRAVHDMDITDKHQALLPVIGAATVPIRNILNLPPEMNIESITTIIVKDGQIVVGIPNYAGTPALGTELPTRFFLAFTALPGLGSREVFEALHYLVEATHGVFKTLTALRPGAAFPSPVP